MFRYVFFLCFFYYIYLNVEFYDCKNNNYNLVLELVKCFSLIFIVCCFKYFYFNGLIFKFYLIIN